MILSFIIIKVYNKYMWDTYTYRYTAKNYCHFETEVVINNLCRSDNLIIINDNFSRYINELLHIVLN